MAQKQKPSVLMGEQVETFDNAVLADKYKMLDLVEAWCKAVRDRVYSELCKGNDVPGFKLVSGRSGNRKWSNEPDVIEGLAKAGVPEEHFYEKTLVSPTAMERKVKAKIICADLWGSLATFVARGEGKPCVVPVDDPRNEIERGVEADLFQDETDLIEG